MEIFPQIVTGIREWTQNLAKHLWWSFLHKKSYKRKAFTIFVRTSIFSILDVWQGSEYASELAFKVTDVSVSISKVTGNLLGKTKKNEPNEPQNSRAKIMLNKSNS